MSPTLPPCFILRASQERPLTSLTWTDSLFQLRYRSFLSAAQKAGSNTGTVSLSQTLAVCASTTYTLSFNSGEFSGSGCTLVVTLGGQSRCCSQTKRSLYLTKTLSLLPSLPNRSIGTELFNGKPCSVDLPCPLTTSGVPSRFRLDTFAYTSPAVAGAIDLVFTHDCAATDDSGFSLVDNVSLARAA